MIFDETNRETVTFSKQEWDEMMSDPVFWGFSCRNGHAIREDDPAVIANGCPTCFELGEMQADIYSYEGDEPDPATLRAFDRYARKLRDFPVVKCGNCRQDHVGKGAVKRCYADSGRFA